MSVLKLGYYINSSIEHLQKKKLLQILKMEEFLKLGLCLLGHISMSRCVLFMPVICGRSILLSFFPFGSVSSSLLFTSFASVHQVPWGQTGQIVTYLFSWWITAVSPLKLSCSVSDGNGIIILRIVIVIVAFCHHLWTILFQLLWLRPAVTLELLFQWFSRMVMEKTSLLYKCSTL